MLDIPLFIYFSSLYPTLGPFQVMAGLFAIAFKNLTNDWVERALYTVTLSRTPSPFY